MRRYAAYIGASGHHAVPARTAAAPAYFLALAVVVDEASLPALRPALASIRAGFFGTGAMTAGGLGDERRVALLQALAPLPFHFYAVAVDKTRIGIDSPRETRTSAAAFANERLYHALFQNLGELTVHADGGDDTGFVDSFRRYLDTAHAPDLFFRPRLETVEGDTEVLAQLAGFLAATAAAVYEDSAGADTRQVFLDGLGARRIRIDEWPPRFESDYPPAPGDSALDAQVRTISLRAAVRFLSDFSDMEDSEGRMQHAVLSYLLFRARFPADEAFIATQELVEHLGALGFAEVDKHYLRSNIVSKLRDRGVLIASSARGYKIPTTYADVIGFAELVDGIVSPLLHRLRRANELFSLGSGGAIDFLADERFRKLRQILELDDR